VAGTTAAWAEPVTLSNVALIETVPSAIAVTRPLAETVAMSGFEEVQLAVVVTFSVVPFDMFATAAYCDDEPTAGAAPLTVTVDTVDGAVAEPQALASTQSPIATSAIGRTFVQTLPFRPDPTCLIILAAFRLAVRWLHGCSDRRLMAR
jgi:hypothetical protein